MHKIQEFISKIRIKFNEKFIKFIINLKKENDISMLLNSNISYILPTQKEIRKYIYNFHCEVCEFIICSFFRHVIIT